MPDLHIAARPAGSPVQEIVSPGTAPLKWLTLRLIRLSGSSPEYRFETGEEEAVLDIFGGMCTVNITARAGSATFPEIGGRQNVFAGRPTMVYIPRGAQVSISVDGETFEGALVSTPARQGYSPALVYPEEAQVRTVGKDNWTRTVITSVGDNVRADRLMVGETLSPPGNWSSVPPYRHDRTGEGAALEGLHLYRLNPAQGFALQRVYTAPDEPDAFDVTYSVRDGDLVALPRGYHPVVAAPGYQLFYLWALAGEERKVGARSDDPEHAWIKGAP